MNSKCIQRIIIIVDSIIFFFIHFPAFAFRINDKWHTSIHMITSPIFDYWYKYDELCHYRSSMNQTMRFTIVAVCFAVGLIYVSWTNVWFHRETIYDSRFLYLFCSNKNEGAADEDDRPFPTIKFGENDRFTFRRLDAVAITRFGYTYYGLDTETGLTIMVKTESAEQPSTIPNEAKIYEILRSHRESIFLLEKSVSTQFKLIRVLSVFKVEYPISSMSASWKTTPMYWPHKLCEGLCIMWSHWFVEKFLWKQSACSPFKWLVDVTANKLLIQLF